MLTFFTADTHFCDIRVLKHRPRFESVEEMNEQFIRRWNETVPPDGIVFHLGDLIEGTDKKATTLLERLNGTIYLIEGNHDSQLFQGDFFRRCKNVIPIGRDRTIKIGTRRIILHHYPFLCYAGEYQGTWQLFGHVHSGRQGRGFDLPRLANLLPYQYDVGVDNNNDAPIPFTKLVAIMDGRRDFAFMSVRPAELNEIPIILEIARGAREFMAERGNPDEWDDHTFTEEVIRQDIETGAGMVVTEMDEVVGYFAAVDGKDVELPPVGWQDSSEPFLWLTRIASKEEVHGVFHQIYGHCLSRSKDIRLITSEVNRPMMQVLKSHYFKKVGTIMGRNRIEMITYQKVTKYTWTISDP